MGGHSPILEVGLSWGLETWGEWSLLDPVPSPGPPVLLLWSVRGVAWCSSALLTLLSTNTSIRLWPVLWGCEFCGFLGVCFSSCGVEMQGLGEL